MKSNFKILSIVSTCILASSLVWTGCQTYTPTATTLSQAVTDKFEMVDVVSPSGSQNIPHVLGASINPNLVGSPSGGVIEGVSYSTPITVCGGPTPFKLVPSGFGDYNETYSSSSNIYNGPGCKSLATVGFDTYVFASGLTDGYDQYAIGMYGYINDPENSQYPPGAGNGDGIDLEVIPVSPGGVYDVSSYQGIQFYIEVALDDTAPDRQFLIYVQQNQPIGQSGGSCLSPGDPSLTHCYDGYLHDYENVPKNQWVLMQENWGDFKQYGFGSITSPPTLSGANLQQISVFEWFEGNTNLSGPVTVDYGIAGIRFY